MVPAIVFIAMAATFLCHTFRIGPPGAYLFALACAAGTAMPASTDPIGLLVLGGGIVSWVMHLCGALFAPRGPEQAAVAAGGPRGGAVCAGHRHPCARSRAS
ncbi:MAG: hypothetical protein WDN30_03740 [Pararobbsia sp.]